MFSRKTAPAFCLGVLLLLTPLLGQRTPLRMGWNLFTPQQDVEIGRTLAEDADAALDWSQDQAAQEYIASLGDQLAQFAPGYKYPYEFRIFNDPSIESLALPGGMIYVSSGLVLAAQNEPQLAGILAHQIGHVVSRHGTQQVSTAYSNRTNSRRSNVSVDEVISLLNLRPDPGSLALKYNARAEAEADTVAVQLLYDARFDPQVLTAGMQRLLNQPANLRQEFALDHPTPANRAAAVRRELQRLGPLTASLRGDSPSLRTAQRNLRNEATLPPPSITNNRGTDLPSNRFITYQGADLEIRYPENWTVSENGSAVTIAPEMGNFSGSIAYGMLIDTFAARSRDLPGRSSFAVPNQAAQPFLTLSNVTDQLVADLRRTNPNLRVVRSSQKQLNGDPALEVELNNDSPLGGREVNRLTTVLRNEVLYYFLAVAPQAEFNRYSATFERMTSSVRFY